MTARKLPIGIQDFEKMRTIRFVYVDKKENVSASLMQIYRNFAETKWNHEQFFDLLNQLLALIPYDLYLKHEKHYQSLFYLIIKLTGLKIDAEVHTQLGRVDAALIAKDKILIFEFKLDKTAKIALKQIKEKKYLRVIKLINSPST